MSTDEDLDSYLIPSTEIASVFAVTGVSTSELIDFAASGLVRFRFVLLREIDAGIGSASALITSPDECSDPKIWVDWDATNTHRRSISWHTGTITFERSVSAIRWAKWTAIGASFELSDLEKLFPGFGKRWHSLFGEERGLPLIEAVPEIEADRGEARTQRQNPGGAPRENEKWEAAFIALLKIALDGKLDRGTTDFVRSQAALRRLIVDDPECTRLKVNDETIKPFIRKVWNTLVDPDGPV